MATFAAMAGADGIDVRVLAAPEIHRDGSGFDERLAAPWGRILAHVRFGSPCLPRILKRAANVVVLAEDVTIPVRLGRHPFAAGAALPAGVGAALSYDASTPIPERIGAGPVPRMVLPPEFTAFPQGDKAGEGQPQLDRIVLQSCATFSKAYWLRGEIPKAKGEGVAAKIGRIAVLLPWNLGAPGSSVPDLLQRVSLLAAQNRFPLTVVVLPYNDVPGGLAILEEVAAALCALHDVGPTKLSTIVLARTAFIEDSLTLVALCKRVWIDTNDPEWRWTLRRAMACGLPANFISALPANLAERYDPGVFTPDELVTRQTDNRFGRLFWQTRVLSLRRLALLAESILSDADMPCRPGLPLETPMIGSMTEKRRTVRELLQQIGFVDHG